MLQDNERGYPNSCMIEETSINKQKQESPMNMNRLRNMAGTALIAVGLLAGTVAPLAAESINAAPFTAAPTIAESVVTESGAAGSMVPVQIPVDAHPFECYYNGNYYPIGTKLAAGPLFYRQCEWGWVNTGIGGSRLEPVWKIYPRN